jgi:hypothetical protein
VTVSLAPALQRVVQRRFPGYALPRVEWFDLDLVAEMPFACVGDFDGNGLRDAALLLHKRVLPVQTA